MAATFILAVGPIVLRVPAWLGQPGFERGLADLHALPTWFLTLAVIIGGVVEEILYRGFAIGHLGSLFQSQWLAAIVVVIAFGLAHWPLWGWAPALTTVLSGALLTAFFLVHGDLTANILAHVATDFVGITLPALSARRPSRHRS